MSNQSQYWNLFQVDTESVLKSIQNNNLIFVSAQPDTTYFHWQVEIYLYQFAKQGLVNRCYALFGHSTPTPSEYAKQLAKKYPNVLFFKDERRSVGYSPTIRPHILAKFFRAFPHLGKNVFYHDSDIFLVKMPRFDLMLHDRTAYLSDTIGYIGYEYLKDCSERYKQRYPILRDLDLFHSMCDIVGVDYNTVILNQKNSGGAQYLLKNIDYKFWEECEEKCAQLYDFLCEYEKMYPISNHIQKWTTDMWVVLWLYWKRGGRTLIHKELDFSWATGTVKDYKTRNIFHLAGVVEANNSDKFDKAKYKKHIVFEAYHNDPTIFDHINPENATFEYVKIIKEYTEEKYSIKNTNNRVVTAMNMAKNIVKNMTKSDITNNFITPSSIWGVDNIAQPMKNNFVQKNVPSRIAPKDIKSIRVVPKNRVAIYENNSTRESIMRLKKNIANPFKPLPSIPENDKLSSIEHNIHQEHHSDQSNNNVIDEEINQFTINGGYIYAGIYEIDRNVMCCKKHIWRSNTGLFIIFWNGASWVLTYSKYESEIGERCGGIISSKSENPYTSTWDGCYIARE